MNEAVKSAARVLDLLELFSAASEPIGVSEASRLTGIPKSSAQALLTTLASREYLEKTALGYEMSSAHKRHGWVGGPLARVRKTAGPMMKRLAESTGESAFLSVLAPDFAVKYVAKAISPADVRYDPPLAQPRPAYAISAGLVLLAWLSRPDLGQFFRTVRLEPLTANTPSDPDALRGLLEKIRVQGYAELFDGRVQGLSGVSGPILDDAGEAIAALTLAGPTARFMKSRRLLRERVVEAVADIGARIATRQRRPALDG